VHKYEGEYFPIGVGEFTYSDGRNSHPLALRMAIKQLETDFAGSRRTEGIGIRMAQLTYQTTAFPAPMGSGAVRGTPRCFGQGLYRATVRLPLFSSNWSDRSGLRCGCSLARGSNALGSW
jgi:hypothetical protein